MGQVNQPSNLLDRIKRAEQQIQRLWKSVGLASATISKGGLTLLQDAFLRMVDDNDTEILYFGPGADGKQYMRIRREDGSMVMGTGRTSGGKDFWALTDRTGRILVSDDAVSGVGLARPWLPIPLYPMFISAGAVGDTYPYANIDAAKIAAETLLWEGRASISHPWISIEGVWGSATGSPTTTYRLKVGETQVGSWTATTNEVSRKGPFDVSAQVGNDWSRVQLTASASGTGSSACQPLGCYLHQTT